MKELWKSKEINGLVYYISNFGNVKTSKNIIKTRKDKDGYLIFTAGKKNKRKVVKIHRLVAELFIPNPDNKPEVNHLDFHRENPNVENLDWCTHEENVKYTLEYNKSVFIDNTCENNPNSKLNKENVILIKKLLKDSITVADIARTFNVGWQTINHIKQGNTWKNI